MKLLDRAFMRLRRAVGFGLCVLAVLLGAVVVGCGNEAPPEIPLGANGQPDPQLVAGRQVWGNNCVSCHSNDGSGGRGKKLNEGRVVQLYPDIEDQIRVITKGKGNGMPSFGDRLTETEIADVVAYTREVL